MFVFVSTKSMSHSCISPCVEGPWPGGGLLGMDQVTAMQLLGSSQRGDNAIMSDWFGTIRVGDCGLSSSGVWHHHCVEWVQGNLQVEVVWWGHCSVLEEVLIWGVISLSNVVVWGSRLGLGESGVIGCSKGDALSQISGQGGNEGGVGSGHDNWGGSGSWSGFNWNRGGCDISVWVWVAVDDGGVVTGLSAGVGQSDLLEGVYLEGEVSYFNWWFPGGLELDGVGAGSEGVEVDEAVSELVVDAGWLDLGGALVNSEGARGIARLAIVGVHSVVVEVCWHEQFLGSLKSEGDGSELGGGVAHNLVVWVAPVVMHVIDLIIVEASLEAVLINEEDSIIIVALVWNLSLVLGSPEGRRVSPRSRIVISVPWVSHSEQVCDYSSSRVLDLVGSQDHVGMTGSKTECWWWWGVATNHEPSLEGRVDFVPDRCASAGRCVDHVCWCSS